MTEILDLSQPLPNYDVIYVSPHLDDAVFSCASHIKSQLSEGRRVLVVTIFTAGCDTRPDLPTLKDSLLPWSNLKERRYEDRQAMQALGADFLHLDLPEVLFRHSRSGKGSRGGRGLLPGTWEVANVWIRAWVADFWWHSAKLETEITEKLSTLIAKTSCPWLVGPAAIGFHPDHLIVQRACARLTDQVLKYWQYYEFPYCTYHICTFLRRRYLDVGRPQVWEVELPHLDPEQVKERKELISVYRTQVDEIFGSVEGLGQALAKWPDEHFLEVQRDGCVLPVPKAVRRSHGSAVRFLCCMTALDVVITLVALYFVRNTVDWSDFTPNCLRSAYSVIILSILRAVIIILHRGPASSMSQLLGFFSTFFAAAAFTLNVEVKSITLLVYYTCEMWLGCAEQSTASYIRRQRQPTIEAGPNRVLVVSDYMPPQTHGISTHTQGLVSALREMGILVHVYTTMDPPEGLDPDGCTFQTCSMQNPWNHDVRLAVFPSAKLLWTILVDDWDVIHIVNPSLIGWPIMITAWLAGVPVYISQHCSEKLGWAYFNVCTFYPIIAVYVFLTHLPAYFFCTINAGPTEGFLSSSPFLRCFEPDRLAVVPSSVNAAIFNRGSGDRQQERAVLQRRLGLDETRSIWLLVSRLAPEKDVDELLGALRYLCDRCSAKEVPYLIIAGDGPLRGQLERQAKVEALPVHFLGMVPHLEVPSLYRACDACVTNSVHETFGLTVIESLACGCPMVMPHCDVFDELYKDPLNDWMYEKWNPESLVSAMRSATQASAREQLAALQEQRRFNRNLFWTWREAAEENARQYRKAQGMALGWRLRRHAVARAILTLVTIITVLTMITVLAMGAMNTRVEMHMVYAYAWRSK